MYDDDDEFYDDDFFHHDDVYQKIDKLKKRGYIFVFGHRYMFNTFCFERDTIRDEKLRFGKQIHDYIIIRVGTDYHVYKRKILD